MMEGSQEGMERQDDRTAGDAHLPKCAILVDSLAKVKQWAAMRVALRPCSPHVVFPPGRNPRYNDGRIVFRQV